jgi:hypothetical protein
MHRGYISSDSSTGSCRAFTDDTGTGCNPASGSDCPGADNTSSNNYCAATDTGTPAITEAGRAGNAARCA